MELFESKYDKLRTKAKIEYEAMLRAIDDLEKMEEGEPVSAPQQSSLKQINMSEIDAAANEGKSLIDAVYQIFTEYPTRNWNITTVHKALELINFNFKAKKPKSSIATALSKLEEKGSIKLCSRGAGRSPNEYRLTAEDLDKKNISGANGSVVTRKSASSVGATEDDLPF